MRKTLLKSIAALALAVGSPAWLWADNVVYGLQSSWDGTMTASFDLDAVNSSAATAVATEFSLADISEVKCGVSAGNKYYAFIASDDPDTGNQTVALVTVNFTTGEKVIVNDFSYGYGKPGWNISGLTYDAASGYLYGIELGFDDSDQYVTKLYSIDPESGDITEVTSWPGQYQAIAKATTGGFYLLKIVPDGDKSLPNLYKVSASFGVGDTPAVANTTVNTGMSSNYSLVAAEDGKTVYAVVGKKVVTFDLTANTTTLKGETSKIVSGVTYGKSTEDGTHNEKPNTGAANTRFLLEKRTFGSSMGDISTDVVSHYERYYYNVNGKKVAAANFGRNYGETGGASDDFSTTDITKYSFDENGNPKGKDTYQWGMYDFDDYSWKKTRNSEHYVYDESGKLLSDTTSIEYTDYTYDEDGRLETESRYIKSTKKLSQKLTYSQFDDKGNPWHCSSEGAYDSYNYEVDYNYDEDGNKTEEIRYRFVPDPDYPTDVMPEYIQHETWTYTDGILAQYEKYDCTAGGKETLARKTVYSPVDGNTNLINVNDYTYYDGQEYQGDLPQQLVYGDFSGMNEMTAMEMDAVPDAEQINTVDLMFTMPQLANSQNFGFVVYRDCLPVDTITVDKLQFDDMTQMCYYKDARVKNGNHTYFIQPIFSANSEFGPMDLDEPTDVEPVEWTGYYSTMPVDIDIETALPAVTDLKLAGGEKKTEGTSLADTRTNYYADLTWTNPENTAEYGFKKNSVYFAGAGVAETDIDNASATAASVMLYDEDADVYVVTSYELGKAISDTITVKLNDVKDLSAIDAVTADGTRIAFSNNTLTLGSNANVAVFSVAGQKLSAEDNVSSVSLADLPKGTYIVTVEKNGKVSAYKYNVK